MAHLESPQRRLLRLQRRKDVLKNKVVAEGKGAQIHTSPVASELDALVWACEILTLYVQGLNAPFTPEQTGPRVTQFKDHSQTCRTCSRAISLRLVGKSEEEIDKLRCPMGRRLFELAIEEITPPPPPPPPLPPESPSPPGPMIIIDRT